MPVSRLISAFNITFTNVQTIHKCTHPSMYHLTMISTNYQTVPMQSPGGIWKITCFRIHRRQRHWSLAQSNRSKSLTVHHQNVERYDLLKPLYCVRSILSVTIDLHLTFGNDITNIVQSCNYHIRSLRHICWLIDKDAATTVVYSIVSSRLV